MRLTDIKFQFQCHKVDDYIEVPLSVAIRIRDFIEAYDQWISDHPEILGETCGKCVSDDMQGYVLTHGEHCQRMRDSLIRRGY